MPPFFSKRREITVERTISGMMGKGSVNHNTRKFLAENVDKERCQYNIEYCNDNLKKVYHELFHTAMIQYNLKQKRSDRVITDYYEKIRMSRQEKLFHEVVFQIGNKEDMNAKCDNGELSRRILDEFMKSFQSPNPYLRVFSSHLYMDEETPHLHIDFVPFINESKRGMETRVSLKQTLAAQGFHGGTKQETEWNQWIGNEKQELAKVMGRFGVQWKQLETHNKHLSVLDYQKQERIKEVNLLEDRIDNAEQKLIILGKKEQEKQAELNVLGNKSDKVLKEIQSLSSKKMMVERNIHIYDDSPEWQLPEPSAFSGAKNYKESKVKPFVLNLKQTIKDLTIQYIHAIESLKQAKTQLETMKMQSSKMTEQLIEVRKENDILKYEVKNYKRVKLVMGENKVIELIENAKLLEKTKEKHNKKEFTR